MKRWPKVKLGQVLVGSNISQNHTSSRKSYLAIVCPNSHEKLIKSEIRSSHYLLQFGFIHSYLTQKYNLFPYLGLFTYIYHYLPIFGRI